MASARFGVIRAEVEEHIPVSSWCIEHRSRPHQGPGHGREREHADFFDTLINHAVPLDYRALGALKHSAIALDIYT